MGSAGHSRWRLCGLAAALLAVLPGWAADAEWHVSALGSVAVRTTGLEPPGSRGGAFLGAEERLRVEATAWARRLQASAHLRVELVHDAVSGQLAADWREAFVDLSSGPWDFRVGRQPATWGVGDLLFINDVFPKDWSAFYSGAPTEYLRRGVNAARIRYSSKGLNGELLVTPFFSPDRLPSPRRFWQFDPAGGAPVRVLRPATGLANTETALRLYGQAAGFDLSAYAYRGFWRTPGARPSGAAVTFFYPRLAVYGLSAQGPAFGGIVSLETGYYDSRGDEGGDDPSVPNSQLRFLAGYQASPRDDLRVGAQYYAEIMLDHSAYQRTLPSGFPAVPAYRDLLTLRLTRLLRQQTLQLSSFAAYSPTGRDYLWQPAVSYALNDHLNVTAGANLFGGPAGAMFFGQFDRDDNVYSWMRYDF